MNKEKDLEQKLADATLELMDLRNKVHNAWWLSNAKRHKDCFEILDAIVNPKPVTGG